jgi:hypothetical protein
MFELLIVFLSVYGISSLLVDYDGPFGIFYRLRNLNRLRSVLRCQVCTGFYLALPFLLFVPFYIVLAAYGLLILVAKYE